MKKLNLVLHETTILNFPFMGTLLRRYWYLALSIPIIIFTLSFYRFNDQNYIHVRSIFFINTTSDTSSPSSAVSAVIMGERENGLSETDIVGILNSVDFQQEFAEIIYGNSDFNKIDLSSISSKLPFNMYKFLESCTGNEKCIYKKIRGAIFGFFSIEPDRIVSTRFSLKVMTRDPFTTTFLLKELSKYIVSNRVEAIRHKIEEQIAISKQLLEERKEELVEYKIDSLKDQKKSLEERILEVKSKISSYNSFFHRLKLELDLMETKVKETKLATKDEVKTDMILALQRRKRYEEKIRKLESDIGAIKVVSQKLSYDDEQILFQLKNELRKVRVKLSAMGKRGRAVSSEMQFINRKEGDQNFTEFDYKVKKEQFQKTKKDYEALIAEKEQLNELLFKVDSQIEDIMPSLEYIKVLEEKLIQLKLTNSTVVSDLKFENELGPKLAFKKLTKFKTILFAVVSSVFLVLALVIVLYLFDDKIYNKYELERTFDDLTIIGNTPDFD